MWRNHQATALATPTAFRADPGLVWLFYSYRRHRALQAKPNAGHVALAKLAEKMPNFITLTQNVDGEFSSLDGKVMPPDIWSIQPFQRL